VASLYGFVHFSEQGIQIGEAMTMAFWHMAKQQGGGQNMVVPCEVPCDGKAKPCRGLSLPVFVAQLRTDFFQFSLVDFTAPIFFLGKFEFAFFADTGIAEDMRGSRCPDG